MSVAVAHPSLKQQALDWKGCACLLSDGWATATGEKKGKKDYINLEQLIEC